MLARVLRVDPAVVAKSCTVQMILAWDVSGDSGASRCYDNTAPSRRSGWKRFGEDRPRSLWRGPGGWPARHRWGAALRGSGVVRPRVPAEGRVVGGAARPVVSPGCGVGGTWPPGRGEAGEGPCPLRFARTPPSAVWFSPSAPRGADHPGRLAQRESASFTPKRSLVRSQYRPPYRCSSEAGPRYRGSGLSRPGPWSDRGIRRHVPSRTVTDPPSLAPGDLSRVDACLAVAGLASVAGELSF